MRFIFFILFSFFICQSRAQDIFVTEIKDRTLELDNYSYDTYKKRKNILIISEISAYTIALVGLNQLWYANYPRSSFHFINDNQEWLQMDKIGHMSASYYTGVAGIKAYKWAGFTRNKAIWYGGMTGSLFLTIIEILDGTSKEWGASFGDLAANTTGSLLAISQALKWNEQRIQLKYSYSPTQWAVKNPEQLGANSLERALKDYNGQTYWLVCNLKSVLNIDNEIFPDWLSFGLGYSANSMISPLPTDDSYRQYFLSFDIDLNKISTKSKFANSILHTFGFLKFPMPTIEFSRGNFCIHPIYY